MSVVRLNPDPAGASVARFIICEALSTNMPSLAAEMAAAECRSTPQVARAYDLILQRKGAVEAGSTANTGYGAELSLAGLGSEAFNLVTSRSAYGRLFPLMPRVPWRVRTPRETGLGAVGSWRGQGLPTPARSTLTDTIALEYAEASVLAVLTKEAMRFGPLSESFIARGMALAVAKFIDGQLLDPSVAATSTSPASITYAAPTVTSTGSTAAQITTDLASMVAAMETPMDNARWVMRPATYFTIMARLAAAGSAHPPGTLIGIPVIVASTSPAQIALIDPDVIAHASDGEVAVDVNAITSIEMVDESLTQDANAGTGTTLVSMLQNGAVAIKATLAANWAPIATMPGSPSQTAGVCTMQVTY